MSESEYYALLSAQLCTKSVSMREREKERERRERERESITDLVHNSTAHNTVPKLLLRLFIESPVIVFRDSYLES